MFYSSTSATDALQDSTLSLALPRAAMKIPGLAQAIGAFDERSATGCAVLQGELASASWEWDTENLDVFNDSGEPDRVEVRVNLTMSGSAENRMGDRFGSVAKALNLLGVPCDMQLFLASAQAHERHFGRLGEDPFGPCQSAKWPQPPSWARLARQAQSAQTLEQLRQWIAQESAEPVAIEEQAPLFEALLGLPGREAFLGASLQWIQWSESKTPVGQADWELAQARELHLFAGESPLERLARFKEDLGLPRMVELARVGAGDPQADPRLVSAILEAIAPRGAVVVDGQAFQTDAMARFCADAFGDRPDLVAKLSGRSRDLLALPLVPAKADNGARAQLEAGWLRLQTLLIPPPAAKAGPRL